MICVMELECGHLIWERRREPRKEAVCVTCWWGERKGAPTGRVTRRRKNPEEDPRSYRATRRAKAEATAAEMSTAGLVGVLTEYELHKDPFDYYLVAAVEEELNLRVPRRHAPATEGTT